jgi:mannose-1-phosphate guanylyltransferase
VEKPGRDAARTYLEGGNHFWNSGIFMFRPARFLAELERLEPELGRSCRESLAGAVTDVPFTRPDDEIFRRCAAISIDYAIMERCRDAVVVPVDMGWSDVGSWKGYWEAEDKDAEGNVVIGDARAYATRNSLLRADGKLLVTLGVDDLVVIDTEDATLVAAKDRSEEIKSVVADLKRAGREETASHVEVYRPWGSFKRIEQTPYFQVKRLTLKPGARISLQLHHRRSEHWVVVKGVARVIRGERTLTLHENESTFIPVGTKHQLENPGEQPLEVVEVQTGVYFGEDDIVRFEDDYGRI